MNVINPYHLIYTLITLFVLSCCGDSESGVFGATNAAEVVEYSKFDFFNILRVLRTRSNTMKALSVRIVFKIF